MIYLAIGGALLVAVLTLFLLHRATKEGERYETAGDRDDIEE